MDSAPVCERTDLGSTAHSDAGVAPSPPRHLRRTAAESRAAMLHACARRGSGTRPRLLPRAVLMDIGQNSTPSSAQVTAKPHSSCAIVASEVLASPRPPPMVMKGQGWVCMRTLLGAREGFLHPGCCRVQYRRVWCWCRPPQAAMLRSYRTLKRSASRRQTCASCATGSHEVCMVSSGRALLKPTGSSPWLERLGPSRPHGVETLAAAEAHDSPG
jgi:hypothetical protein